MYRIESLLSARLFLQPQIVGDHIYFESNLSGHISLYAMKYGGSVPEPLLPPNIALHNPHLLTGKPFYVYPKLGKILVMIDQDGNEKYQPMLIPIQGGYPVPAFGEAFDNYRVSIDRCDSRQNIVYLMADSISEPLVLTYQGNLATGELILLGESPWGFYPEGVNHDHTQVTLLLEYTRADRALYLWDRQKNDRKLLYGVPLETRAEGQKIPLNDLSHTCFTAGDRGLLLVTALFDEFKSLGYLDLHNPAEIQPVTIEGVRHQGLGELTELEPIGGDRYLVTYNVNGASWLYEGKFDERGFYMVLGEPLCGDKALDSGVLESVYYDESTDRIAFSFSTATSPTQIFSVEGGTRDTIIRHTNERLLDLPSDLLSPGEDASFVSFDGLHIPARLYLPAESLRYTGPRPLIYYIHGGPQSQERPDFAWFSIPLIQFLTLNGFAVFVPNVRGSAGYGLSYTKRVDRDWGGQDRLDHVHAMTHVLPSDPRLDTTHTGVVGRSYGGYMTLTLVGRHPELWSAGVDMFGPYDLITFSERIPETWKPYFKLTIGDPEDEADRRLLAERSPRTYLDHLSCPLFVIQGKNDPRVVERESSDLVSDLRRKGKDIDYLVFENEGHDVLKYENRVTCYTAITEFFTKYLKP